MKLLLILLFFLMGCTKEITIIETINETIYINQTINNTIYIYNTTIEPCNETLYNRDYVLGLIRQLKHYEEQQDIYYNYNDTNCFYDLNQSNIELNKCKHELCYENSSWC